MRKLCLVLVFCGAASGARAADWDRFLETGFSAEAPQARAICFARVYDAAHLAANKAQRIRDIAIRLAIRVENGKPRLEQHLVAHLVGSARKFVSNGECRKFRGRLARCHVEGDGGGVDLTLARNGEALTARFDNLRIWRPQEAADESGMVLDRSPVDKVARLDKAALSACAAAGD
ncbi:MAG: hypothetical protein ACK5JM_12175 [Rhodoblastus sp.]